MNKITYLYKTLTERLFPQTDSLKSLDRIITDFDFTTYHISTLPDDKSQLVLSLNLKCWNDLVSYNVEDYLQLKYSSYKNLTILPSNQVEQGYNYSIVLDIASAVASDDEDTKLRLIDDLSLLKRNAMAAAFHKAFDRYDELLAKYSNSNTYAEEIQQELANEPVLVIKYRGADETIYLKPSFDRVTVIFRPCFKMKLIKCLVKCFTGVC